MVCGGISWKRETPLVVVNGTLNAEEYVNMLQEFLLPFRDEFYPQGIVFQQDNAPAHTANFTHEFFYGRRNHRHVVVGEVTGHECD